jgi:phospholipid/cholesterol/gamma-HCH transport system ATP-binding protein
VKNLSFNRGERVIYDNVDLKIRRGQITGIMGPSGTGKTTLLRLIGGQLTPDRGEVLLDGKILQHVSSRVICCTCAYGYAISKWRIVYRYVCL